MSNWSTNFCVTSGKRTALRALSCSFSVCCLDVVVLDDLEPALLLGLVECSELLGRAGEDFEMDLLDELLHDVGRAHGLGELGVHAVDDRPRHAGRPIET